MENIYREKVDFKVAFSTSMKRSEQDSSSVNASPNQALPATGSEANSYRRTKLKRTLIPVGRFGMRLIRPIAKPLLSRLRGYFLSGLRADILAEIHRSSEQTITELRTRSEQLETMLAEIRRNSEALSDAVSLNQARISAEIALVHPYLERIESYSAHNARRFALNSGSDIIVRTNVGYVLCPADDHALITLLAEAGELEPGTRRLIERLLKPGDTFVDVGANVGLHTLAAARAMQGNGNIIAFEPFARTKQLLEKTVWLNGFSSMTTVHEVAVSNRSGPATLHLGATSGHHSLTSLDVPISLRETEASVRTVTLDEMISQDLRVNLIKIDVEGAELDVLQGAQATLACNSDVSLIVEFGQSHLKRTGHTAADWIAKFADVGFEFKAVHAETGELYLMPLNELELQDSVNLLFTRTSAISNSFAQDHD